MAASIGFVGLGRMGLPMAGRLMDAGHTVSVFDRSEAALARAEARGGRRAASLAAVADEAEIVFISLPTPDIVEAVVLGEGGLASGKAVRAVVDISTTGPRVTGRIAAALGHEGRVVFMDAPISGGVAGAEKGTLALMASGPRATYDEIEPLLKCWGKAFFVGDKPGQGQVLKLANNILSVAAMAVTSEAMVMGAKAGLDPKVMIEVINLGSGRNSATQDKFPRSVLPRTFDFGFATGLSYKDVRLCVDEAEALGVPMVVGGAVRQFLAMANAAFGPESDFTSMVKLVEGWAGAEVDGRG